MSATHRVLFLYWGRKGALSRLTLEAAKAAEAMHDVVSRVSVSTSNEIYRDFERSGVKLVPVRTFESAAGTFRLDRLLAARRQIREVIERDHIKSVVVLMSHMWTPFLAGMVRAAGATYTVVVHDADSHPGDAKAVVTDWLLRDARRASHVVTLSKHVARRLVARGIAPPDAITTLAHPTFNYQPKAMAAPAVAGFGFLFFGRIARYKGLDLFVAAAELLRQRGAKFRIGVVGEGNLEPYRERLVALGAEIDNRWVGDDEIPSILARYDAAVLSHLEASQSGVAVAAFNCGLPVIATAVGGLMEQVRHEETGLVVKNINASDIADAMERMMSDPELYARLKSGMSEYLADLSIPTFVRKMISVAER
ncbi:glycosyltransferase family 4 protein [Blastochloris viridis]|uniref:Glycosyltransferase n=1 Tax=Blastochloris viridis TaxID=1079 RepID=A0A0H5BQ53_BLAVI|nr:glycosyltransferase family 4 protein [Blastochloris viridis]ALK09737.1 2-deoxystreptamine glucosyltransferase [Blastochloris viridis]BAS00369.1 glycosyltransferase [Blastochloris viridis]CUU42400.1 Mannosylfructose-phosphate synthase [Blastochloris viridis]